MGNAPTAMVKLESMAAGREGIALLSRSFPNINARKILARYLLGHIGWLAAVPVRGGCFFVFERAGGASPALSKTGEGKPSPISASSPHCSTGQRDCLISARHSAQPNSQGGKSSDLPTGIGRHFRHSLKFVRIQVILHRIPSCGTSDKR